MTAEMERDMRAGLFFVMSFKLEDTCLNVSAVREHQNIAEKKSGDTKEEG